MRTRPARVQSPRSIRTTATATLRTSKQRSTSDRGRLRDEHDSHRHLALAVLIAVSAVGWVWTGAHQQASQAIASHVVLGLGMLAGVVGVVAIWRAKPHEHEQRKAG